MFKKGQAPGPGRPKGVKNKDTELRNYLIDLLHRKAPELELMTAAELLKPIARLLPTKIDIKSEHKGLIVNINKTIAQPIATPDVIDAEVVDSTLDED